MGHFGGVSGLFREGLGTIWGACWNRAGFFERFPECSAASSGSFATCSGCLGVLKSEQGILTSKLTQMTSKIIQMTSKITQMTSRASKQENGPGPRGGVGEGIIFMYMRIRQPSTRPEAQGLGGLQLQLLVHLFAPQTCN